MRFAMLLLALLAAASPAAAQDSEPYRAYRDGFTAIILTTADSEGFLTAWGGPTPPTLPTTSEAVRGRPVTGMIMFAGCAAGPDGNCNVTAEFVILRPDGSRYGERMRVDIWKSTPASGENLQLGVASPTLIVGPDDPMGTWTVRALVTDNIRGVTLRIEQPLTVDTPPASTTA